VPTPGRWRNGSQHSKTLKLTMIAQAPIGSPNVRDRP
jgi:hypothetical protein